MTPFLPPQVEIPRRHPRCSCVYIEKCLQLKYTVRMPEKTSICLIRGNVESFSNDDVFDQGSHGIVGYAHDDVSFVYGSK